jgi:hypothetical protein
MSGLASKTTLGLNTFAMVTGLDHQAQTSRDVVLLVEKELTNFEKPSSTTKIAGFPLLDLVNGPIKSINTRSKGDDGGVAECKPTAVFWAALALWHRSQLCTYLKTSCLILGQ